MENELLEDLYYWKTIIYDYNRNKIGSKYEYLMALRNINEIETRLSLCY